MLGPGAPAPADVVGGYQRALAAGDVDAVVRTFAPDGYLREPIGAAVAHRGTAELRSVFAGWCRAGGIELQDCAVTDVGVRCAVEYDCLRWGGTELPPRAGIAVCERDAAGLLAAVRVHDDVQIPVATAQQPV